AANKLRENCSTPIPDAETACNGTAGPGSMASLESELGAITNNEGARNLAGRIGRLRAQFTNFGSGVDRMRMIQGCREAASARTPELIATSKQDCPAVNVTGTTNGGIAPGSPAPQLPATGAPSTGTTTTTPTGVCLAAEKTDLCARWLGGLR